ncbi:MAG: TIR domain-containing protein [Bacteroides sp.]|nr:TIR domain-containing protein [Bacteroides sp.]
MAKRVFFSFHYQDVIDFRVNVVRNHNITKSDNAGYFDASIWEDAKRTSDLSLKRLINSELLYTSVTAVLVGTETYERRWVRYELMKSFEKNNKILAIHINGIAGRNSLTKSFGKNPLDYLGFRISGDGKKLFLYEWKNGEWLRYNDLDDISCPTPRYDSQYNGNFYQLSKCYSTFDWIKDDGYNNFEDWIK